MTIDEAIEELKELAVPCSEHCGEKEISCERCRSKDKQLYEWLEELKTYKTWDKFMHYKEEVAYARGFNDGCAKFSVGQDYEDGIDDFVKLYEDTISSSIAYALNHTDEEYHTDIELIYRLAKQLKDGGE